MWERAEGDRCRRSVYVVCPRISATIEEDLALASPTEQLALDSFEPTSVEECP